MTTHYDLLTLPQSGTTIPADTLNAAQAAHVRDDWKNFGNERISSTDGHWTIAIAHTIHGEQRITSTIRIPRSTGTPSAARAARPALEAIDGDNRAASIRRHPASQQPHLSIAA